MDGNLSYFQDPPLSERQMKSFPTTNNTGYTQESFGGIFGTISDVRAHALQVVDATQNISDQATAIKASSHTMGRVSTQAENVSLGLSKQAETIDTLVQSFLAEIRNL